MRKRHPKNTTQVVSQEDIFSPAYIIKLRNQSIDTLSVWFEINKMPKDIVKMVAYIDLLETMSVKCLNGLTINEDKAIWKTAVPVINELLGRIKLDSKRTLAQSGK